MPAPMKVLSQRQTEKVLDDDEVHAVVSISVIVGQHGPFVLDVPVEQYTPENVIPLARDLEYRAESIRLGIEGLHDQPHGAERTPSGAQNKAR